MEIKNNTKWSSDSEIYDQTQKEVIVVNPDTLDNKLRDFEDGINRQREIRHSIELCLTLLAVILTSNFRDFLGIQPNYWFAIFFLAFLWSMANIIRDLICRLRVDKLPSRESILKELMFKGKTNLIKGNKKIDESFTDKFLIREKGRSEVYEVVNGVKRHIPDPDTLIKLGYKWEDVQEVSTETSSKYIRGNPLPSQK